MVILGLHFGHDAGIAVLKNGKAICNFIRERHNRAKHSFGINVSHIEDALNYSNLSLHDVDMIAVSSTQNYELVVVDKPDQLELNFGKNPKHKFPSLMYDMIKPDDKSFINMQSNYVLNQVYSKNGSVYHKNLFPEHVKIKKENMGVTPSLRDYLSIPFWEKSIGIDDFQKINFNDLLNKDSEYISQLFHYPMTICLKGKEIPGVSVQHHAAHAASAFYNSNFNKSAVITHDGGFYKTGPLNGMIFLGHRNYLYPLLPNHLSVGDLYDQVGAQLGFDLFGAAGKLMGLAPYGKPVFFDKKFIGNTYDYKKKGVENILASWLSHCLKEAKLNNYDITLFGNIKNILAPINVDIAASTQKLFEEIILTLVENVYNMFNLSRMHMDNLCYSGGTGLNCPTNSRLFNESSFKNLFIPPNCDDSGLSLGAAQYLYHHILKKPLIQKSTSEFRTLPYLGLKTKKNVLWDTLDQFSKKISISEISNSPQKAAEDINDNKIIAWFEGESEIGPRALGHRSLLANPTYEYNWERLNLLKTREKWRPFAPAVLLDDLNIYFEGLPNESPFMLFTGTVCTNELPAITHIDGSSRVQTVTKEVGGLYKILKHLKKIAGISVVLNTSFNGPGEPIVETPKEAINFLLSTKLDALYIEGKRITKAPY